MHVNYYHGIKKIYFNKIINEIIDIANLTENNNIILDFGCGSKQLEKKLNKKILNYDVNPLHTDLKDYKTIDFNIVIFNHVLMYMDSEEIKKTLNNIKKKNKFCKVVVGISRQSFINKIASWASLNFSAHVGTKTNPKNQFKILQQHMDLISKRSVFNMTDIYLFKFKWNT